MAILSPFESIHLCWVPVHAGIHRIEEADREAKKVADSVDTERVPHSDMNGPVRAYILSK